MSEPEQNTKQPGEYVDTDKAEQQLPRPSWSWTVRIPALAKIQELLGIVADDGVYSTVSNAPVHVFGVVDGPGIDLTVKRFGVSDKPLT